MILSEPDGIKCPYCGDTLDDLIFEERVKHRIACMQKRINTAFILSRGTIKKKKVSGFPKEKSETFNIF